jgi:hypothetical protein
MAIIPVTLPPGMFMDGTPYQAKGRWYTGNRVRWHDTALRPIGGWSRRTKVTDDSAMAPIPDDPATETVRDLFFWDDPFGAVYGLAGTNKGLYYINANNEIANVTPAGFVPGGQYPVILNGYGVSIYGRDTYGTPRSTSGALAVPALRWRFDAWGGEALAMCVQNGPIYRYVPGQPEAVIMSANAPTENADFIVTDQRIVMVIDPNGATGFSREVVWSDSEDFDLWAPDITNQAGSQVLPGVGRLLSIHKVLSQILILSSTDAQVARYLGPPYIYGFERVGQSCGPINGQVCVHTDRFAMWLGDRQFWMYDGTVRPIECDVMDFFITDFDFDWASVCHAHPMAEFNEIWWHYKSQDAPDVDSYIAYNYVQQTWIVGKLDRTASTDQQPTRDPLYVDPTGIVWNHEIKEIEAENAYAVTGPLEIGNGETNMAVRWIYPDTQTMGSVSMSLLARQMPTAPERSFGPYEYRNPTPVRAMGREIRMRVDGVNTRWEVGNMRFEVAEAGTGKR